MIGNNVIILNEKCDYITTQKVQGGKEKQKKMWCDQLEKCEKIPAGLSFYIINNL